MRNGVTIHVGQYHLVVTFYICFHRKFSCPKVFHVAQFSGHIEVSLIGVCIKGGTRFWPYSLYSKGLPKLSTSKAFYTDRSVSGILSRFVPISLHRQDRIAPTRWARGTCSLTSLACTSCCCCSGTTQPTA